MRRHPLKTHIGDGMQASGCDIWLETLYGKIPFDEYTLLDRSARTLLANIIVGTEQNPLPWHPWRGITPSHVGFRGVWNWDTAFHAIGVSHWDAKLAREQILMFLSFQTFSGLLPDVLFEDGRLVDTFGKPPVMPWAAMIINQRHPDLEFVKKIYEPFKLYERHWCLNRGGKKDGLFHYDSSDTDPELRLRNAKYESGWDNAVRWDQGIHEVWPIDLNCFMVMLYQAMSYFAKELNLTEDVKKWNEKCAVLSARIESALWDEENKLYLDYDFGKQEFIQAASPASFMPLYTKIASADRAKNMASIGGDTTKFSPGWPTVSYDHLQFEPEGYWRGRTWLNVAYFALKGLRNYGYDSIAETGRQTILEWVRNEPSAIYENYHSKTGKPLGAAHFGWSSTFIIEFILSW